MNPRFSLPAGIRQVYAFFDYAGMNENLSYSSTWYREGEVVAQGGGKWNLAPEGSTWIRFSDDEPLASGRYRFELGIDGKSAAGADFTIGIEQESPLFGPITFALDVDEDNQPINPATTFASGAKRLYGFWEYSGMRDGMPWTRRWLLNGAEFSAVDAEWAFGESGQVWANVYRNGNVPLADGTYTLELSVGGTVLQVGTATIGKGARVSKPSIPPLPGRDKPRFSNLRFAPAVTVKYQPTTVVTELPSGSTHLYLVFDYENMKDGTTWEARWYFNGEHKRNASLEPRPWRGGSAGTWWVSIFNERGLPDGTYKIELYVEDQKLGEASIPVGSGGGE